MAPAIDGMKQVDYYDVIETGDKIDSLTLNWLVQWAIETGVNLAYEVDGCVHGIGGQAFKRALGL